MNKLVHKYNKVTRKKSLTTPFNKIFNLKSKHFSIVIN